MSVACQQRMLTSPDTWSCLTLGLACVLMLREKRRHLTQSYDKSPYTNRNVIRHSLTDLSCFRTVRFEYPSVLLFFIHQASYSSINICTIVRNVHIPETLKYF